MRERQQNSTAHPIQFLLVLASDHITGAVGITPTVTISKDGLATFAAPAGAITEIGNGWYSLAGNATDRNTLGQLILHATGAGCDPTDRDYTIVGYDPFDGVRLGITSLPNAAAGANNGLPTMPATGANPLSVNATKIGGQAATLDASNRLLVNIIATAADLALNNSATSFFWRSDPNAGSSTVDTLPDQTGMTTTQVKLAASATATNTPNGTVFTPTSGAQTKGRHIVHFDPATQIATLNNAWVTNPVGGDTYRTDPPPKTNTSGYNRQQTAADSLLQNPTFPIANTTDGAGHVSIDPAAIIAGVWPNGALNVVNGVGAANHVQTLGVAATLDDPQADFATYGIAKTSDITPVKTVTDKLATMLQVSGSNWQFTINALAMAPAGGGGGGGLLGTAPLVFVDQRTNTTPTINDSLAMQWLAVCGTLQTNTRDPTKSDLLDPSGNIVFTFDAPVPVQIAPNGLDAPDAAGFSPMAYLRFAAAGAAGNTEGSGPVGTAGTAFLRAVTRDGSPGAVIASMNYNENSDRTVTEVNPG